MSGSTHSWSADLLSAWVADLRFEDLDDATLAKAEDCILDAIGCAVAGFDDPGAAAVKAVAAKTYPAGNAPLWFTGERLSAVGAAYANAAMASALDIDDGHRLAMGHPGAAVVPAALAVAEDLGTDGRALLTAVVAGYEVAVRLGHAEINKPYHTGNWTGFGAAAAALKLMGAGAAEIAEAFAVAAYHSPRVHDLTQSRFMGAHVKESIPWSVITGLTAADLALAGFTGCRDALDLDGRFDPAVIRADMGGPKRIMGVYFKRYSVCRWAHTAIEGLVDILRENGLAPAAIEHVRVDTFRQAAALNNEVRPATLVGAQFSMPYTMAVAAVRGEAALGPLREDGIGDDDAAALAARIDVRHDPAMDAYLPLRTPARVTVAAAGRTYEKTVIQAWGDAGGDTTREDLRAKFGMLAGRMLDDDGRRTVVQGVDALRTGDGRTLVRALAQPAAPTLKRAV